jgi:UDP-N-acetyl-D-galactosamine dehydrogenase
LVVAVGHHEFREMTATQLRQLCKSDKPVLADVKSLYNRHEAADAGFTVFRF